MDNDGRSERLFGAWMRSRQIPRDSVAISTKVVGPGGDAVLRHRYDVLGRRERPTEAGLTKAQICDACDASLARLGVDAIDLYEIHWPARYVPKFGETGARYNPALEHDCASFDEQLDAIQALFESGKIRSWGVSNETTYGLTAFVERCKARKLPAPVSIQNDYSLADRRFETELAEACSLNGIKLLAFGVMCGGTLSGKYNRGNVPEVESRHKTMPGFQSRYTSKSTLKAAEAYEALAAAHHLTPTQLAVNWCVTRDFCASAILGARNADQLLDQLDALKHLDKISPDLVRDVDRVHHRCPNPNYSDTHSQYYAT